MDEKTKALAGDTRDLAVRDEAPLGVELDALARNSSIGMPHEVKVHRGVGVSGRVKPLPLRLDFNTAVICLGCVVSLISLTSAGLKTRAWA